MSFVLSPLPQDFYNLANVYLDAVFFPRAVTDPQVRTSSQMCTACLCVSALFRPLWASVCTPLGRSCAFFVVATTRMLVLLVVHLSSMF